MNPAVVTPTYNEAQNLRELAKRVSQAVPAATLIVVDDGSPDGTGDLAESLDGVFCPVRVIHREGKLGLGSAYRAGFKLALEAGHDKICQIDADLSHDPAVLPQMLSSTADLVLGTRYIPGGGTVNWPLSRKLISRGGSLWARTWLSLPYRDPTGGFKCWTSGCLRAIEPSTVRSEGYVFQIETTYRAHKRGFIIDEVPIVFTERVSGDSKMSARIAREAAWRVPALRLRK